MTTGGRPLRVLWVIKGLGPGGAERLLVTLAEVADPAQVTYSCAYLLADKSQLVPELEAAGVRTTLLTRDGSGSRSWLGALRRLITSGEFDVVHTHSPMLAVATRLAARSVRPSRRPVTIYTEHNHWRAYSRLTRLANAMTHALDDHTFAVSAAVRESIRPHRRREATEVLVHGINRAQPRPERDPAQVRDELGICHEDTMVITVANMRVQKAYPDLIAAATTVLRRHMNVQFVAVGQGPLEASVRELVREAGIQDRFHVLGGRDDVFDLLRAADIFALSSVWEGFPIAVMEAMSTGLPCVATRVGGVPDAIEHEVHGLLVPPSCPAELARALEQMIGDPVRRAEMAQASRTRSDAFDIRRCEAALLRRYREVVGAAPTNGKANVDEHTVEGFGYEWTKFDQRSRHDGELRDTFDAYFRIFPWELVDGDAVGADVGCGSGRWAQFVAPRIGRLICIDPAEGSRSAARALLAGHDNCTILGGSAGSLPLRDASLDFGYSLGVLHHTPEPLAGLRDAVRVLKPGAPFLVYLYYALDNRPRWFRWIWRASDSLRWVVSRAPHRLRGRVADAVAALVYLPLSRVARLVERVGLAPDRIPLSAYRTKPFYVLRTDALDRLGTRVEHRFSRASVVQLMQDAGLESIVVSDHAPYWCALGYRARSASA